MLKQEQQKAGRDQNSSRCQIKNEMRSLLERYMLLCPSEECPALSGYLVLASLNPVLSPCGAQERLRLGDTTLQNSSWELELGCTWPPLLQMWPLEKSWTYSPCQKAAFLKK